MDIQRPYLVFLGDAADQAAAKVGYGIVKWRPGWCIGQVRLPDCNANLDLPDMSLEEGARAGARTLVIGVANRGGRIAESWRPHIRKAVELGMDVASGLHHKLADVPGLGELAREHGRRLIDVRHATEDYPVAEGIDRPGKRVLTVGTDCSIGKMFTSLAIEQEMKRRGMKADFRATGQTGIFIAGGGVPLDAVVADFIAGAAESLTPANDPDHWDIVEGQGSLFHLSFSGVSLGLLHGTRPHALVMCHMPERAHMRGLPGVPLPGLKHCIAVTEQMAAIVSPGCRVAGIALNSAALEDRAARDLAKKLSDETGLPAVDAYRHGAGPLVDALAAAV